MTFGHVRFATCEISGMGSYDEDAPKYIKRKEIQLYIWKKTAQRNRQHDELASNIRLILSQSNRTNIHT
ncbi:MAG: hypothetical protein QMB04_08860 [Pseudomonadales bacterium]